MGRCPENTWHGFGGLSPETQMTTTTGTSRTSQKTTGTTLKDSRYETSTSFLPSECKRQHHEYSFHHSGIQTRHDAHVGPVQGATDRFQHRQSSKGTHPSVHDGYHAGGLSDRSSVGIHRFEPERIRTGIETEESRRNRPDRRGHLTDLSGQQLCPLAVQTDQRAVQQHTHQSSDGHLRLQGPDRHGIEF